MKTRSCLRIVLLAFAGLLAACVPSVNPLYTADTVVFRLELLGVWKEKPDSEESWNFTRKENNTYNVVIQEKDASSSFDGHLVKLGETHFLDLFPNQKLPDNDKLGSLYRASLVPCHLIFKVKLGEQLQLQAMQPDELKDMLAADPKALAHAFPEKDYPVITATTKDLQDFCKKHANSEKLWGDPTEFKKIQL